MGKPLTQQQKIVLRNNVMYAKYNMTRYEYETLAEIQDYKCSICKRVRKLTIDHDHKCCAIKGSCGECIRGLICSQCNTILGMANDDIEILQSAIDYMTQ